MYAQSRYSKEFSQYEKYQGKIQCENKEFSLDIIVFFVLKFFLKATQLQKMVEDLQENTVEVRNSKALLSEHIKVRSFVISSFKYDINPSRNEKKFKLNKKKSKHN